MGGVLVSDCIEKAKHFNQFFLKQCTPLENGSVLEPEVTLLTHSKLSNFIISKELIQQTLKSINVNKARGPDGITGRMIELCGDSLVLPLSIIFKSIMDSGTFPSV